MVYTVVGSHAVIAKSTVKADHLQVCPYGMPCVVMQSVHHSASSASACMSWMHYRPGIANVSCELGRVPRLHGFAHRLETADCMTPLHSIYLSPCLHLCQKHYWLQGAQQYTAYAKPDDRESRDDPEYVQWYLEHGRAYQQRDPTRVSLDSC